MTRLSSDQGRVEALMTTARTPRKRAPRKATKASPTPRFELTEIPRRKLANGKEGGPYVLTPGATRSWGDKKCETCGRMVEPDRKHPRKGKCRCKYYQRTTTWIDVLQDEFLLKMWGNRNVAWGMAQRPDLILAASACKPDSHDEQSAEDKSTLNGIAREAQTYAGNMFKATIGTSLHKLTHQLDRGETLGYVPDPYSRDLEVYESTIKAEGIEWVDIESFRVLDDWVSKTCDHVYKQSKDYDPENPCRCQGVAGTVDRIGWYRDRLTIFDIKTGSTFNKMGHAMQLSAYAHMVPYNIGTDERGVDKAPINLEVGYIIELPEGKGECRLTPMNLINGWGACLIAKQVWEARAQEYELAHDDRMVRSGSTYFDLAARASTRKELKVLAKTATENCCFTPDLKEYLNRRWIEIGA